jgi:MoaA/NifB/PqqE/SkfB family radical SAM enzyme
MVANGGLDIDSDSLSQKRQIDSVILGITRKCTYDCEHCYDYANRSDEESVPVERWIEIIRQLQKIGVSVIIFSGGEPMLRYQGLIDILESADKRISDFHLHTTGVSMSPERACALKKAGLVAAGVSLDYPDAERHDRFRGHRGAFQDALKTLTDLKDAGIFTYTNICLQKDLVHGDGLQTYLDLAKKLMVGTVQLLEPKPCGRYSAKVPNYLFSEDERRIVVEFFTEANQSKRYKHHPPVSYTSYYEKPEHLGCLMGGLSHFTIDSIGNVNPCVFVPISFGNIMKEDFLSIYHRMRTAIPRPIHKECPSVLLRQAIEEQKRHSSCTVVPHQAVEYEWQQMFLP